jgi:2-alkenal reductase
MRNHSSKIMRVLLVSVILSGYLSACQVLPFDISIPLKNFIGREIVQPTPEVAIEVIEPDVNPLPTQMVENLTPVIVEKEGTVVDEQSVLIDLYQQVNPSVVNIIAIYEDPNSSLGGYSEGSGFIFDNSGNIVTNAHVVSGSQAIEVTFYNHYTRSATLIGEDLFSDLAVLRVEDIPEQIAPVTLGDDNLLQVGETVITIGNPFGFSGTMTRGIVSAVGRTIPSQTQYRIPRAIQTDAPINPGNSGGPLLNLAGEVVGVNAQIITDSTDRSNSGIGFAIPVNLVKRVIPALISDGVYPWPWLGITGGDLNRFQAKAMNLPIERGAYISTTVANGPSANAGLLGSTDEATVEGQVIEVGGDVVIKIDDQPVLSFDDLLIYLAMNKSPNQKVDLTIIRDGLEQVITVILGTRPLEQINIQPQIETTPVP